VTDKYSLTQSGVQLGKFVDGFVHRVGAHCESTALRDVFEHFGFHFSEEMLFGLDGTFGFVYWKRKDAVPPLGIGGKIAMFPHKLPSLLGFKVEKKTTTSQKKAWNGVKVLIDRNIPVILHADMAFLDYMHVPKNGEHFGAHTIVLAGYDLERGEAYVADSKFQGLQAVSLENFAKARGSKFKPYPPRNEWFEFTLPRKLKPLSEAIRVIINETARNMLEPATKIFGLRGMRYLADDITSWPSILPQSKLSLTLILGYVWIEEAGTGGSVFRKLYSGFLKEASDLLRTEEIDEASQLIMESANVWTEVAKILLKGSKISDIDEISNILTNVKAKITKCAEIEEKAFNLLKTAV